MLHSLSFCRNRMTFFDTAPAQVFVVSLIWGKLCFSAREADEQGICGQATNVPDRVVATETGGCRLTKVIGEHGQSQSLMEPEAKAMSVASGRAFARGQDQPESLADYIFQLALQNPAGEYIEIDRFGQRQCRTFQHMRLKALDLSTEISAWLTGRPESSQPAGAVLCFEGVLDYVQAVWACLFAGIDVLPVETTGLRASPNSFINTTMAIVSSLEMPLVICDHAVAGPLAPDLKQRDICFIDTGSIATPARREPDETDVGLMPRRSSRMLIGTSGTTGHPKIAVLDSCFSDKPLF